MWFFGSGTKPRTKETSKQSKVLKNGSSIDSVEDTLNEFKQVKIQQNSEIENILSTQVDMSAGNIDVDSINFTEEDMNDPELLIELGGIHGSTTLEVESSHEPDLLDFTHICNDTPGNGLSNVGTISVESVNNIKDLKQKAAAFLKDGNKQEAIDMMRKIKILESDLEASGRIPPSTTISVSEARVEKIIDLISQMNGIDESSRSNITNVKPLNTKPKATETPATTNVVPAKRDVTFEDARQLALQYRNSGDLESAKKWLRYAKSLESGNYPNTTSTQIDSKPREELSKAPNVQASKSILATPELPVAPPMPLVKLHSNVHPENHVGIPHACGVSDLFVPLETALLEASTMCLQQAKIYETTNKTVALGWFRQFKTYQQELGVLQSRRHVSGAVPALFEWKSSTTTEIVTNKDIPADRLELSISSISGIEKLLEGSHNRATVSLRFEVPVTRDSVLTEASPHITYSAPQTAVSYKCMIPITRGKSITSSFSRKKITFEVIHHAGIFSGTKTVGTASLPLAELLSKCELNSDELLIMKEGSRKPIGVSMRVSLRLQTPLEKPELRATELRSLTVYPWPPVGSTTDTMQPATQGNTAAAPTVAAAAAAATVMTTNISKSHIHSPPREVEASQQALVVSPPRGPSVDFSRLSEAEKADPLAVEWLVSSEVMDAEKADVEKQLMSPGLPVEERFLIQMRLSAIDMRLTLLVTAVQEEQLSLPAYLDLLKDRIDRDKLLAVYCSTNGRNDAAKKVMKRILIMQKEVQEAESANIS